MKDAVNKYKGFYIGRYETTVDNGNIGTKKAKDVLNSENWYKMYLYQDNTKYNKNEFYENKFVILVIKYLFNITSTILNSQILYR